MELNHSKVFKLWHECHVTLIIHSPNVWLFMVESIDFIQAQKFVDLTWSLFFIHGFRKSRSSGFNQKIFLSWRSLNIFAARDVEMIRLDRKQRNLSIILQMNLNSICELCPSDFKNFKIKFPNQSSSTSCMPLRIHKCSLNDFTKASAYEIFFFKYLSYDNGRDPMILLHFLPLPSSQGKFWTRGELVSQIKKSNKIFIHK